MIITVVHDWNRNPGGDRLKLATADIEDVQPVEVRERPVDDAPASRLSGTAEPGPEPVAPAGVVVAEVRKGRVVGRRVGSVQGAIRVLVLEAGSRILAHDAPRAARPDGPAASASPASCPAPGARRLRRGSSCQASLRPREPKKPRCCQKRDATSRQRPLRA